MAKNILIKNATLICMDPAERVFKGDLLVEDKVVIEVKAVETLNDIHLAQTLTYLRLLNCKLGLLINFNVKLLKHGYKRVVNHL